MAIRLDGDSYETGKKESGKSVKLCHLKVLHESTKLTTYKQRGGFQLKGWFSCLLLPWLIQGLKKPHISAWSGTKQEPGTYIVSFPH